MSITLAPSAGTILRPGDPGWDVPGKPGTWL